MRLPARPAMTTKTKMWPSHLKGERPTPSRFPGKPGVFRPKRIGPNWKKLTVRHGQRPAEPLIAKQNQLRNLPQFRAHVPNQGAGARTQEANVEEIRDQINKFLDGYSNINDDLPSGDILKAQLKARGSLLHKIEAGLQHLEATNDISELGQDDDYTSLVQFAVSLRLPTCAKAAAQDPEVKQSFDSFVGKIIQIRKLFSDKPQDKPHVTNALVHAIENTNPVSATGAEPKVRIEAANTLLDTIMLGDTPQNDAALTMKESFPGTRSVLSHLRHERYANDVARREIQGMDEIPPEIINLGKAKLNSQTASDDEAIAALSYHEILENLDGDQKTAMQQKIDQAFDAARKRDTCEIAQEALVGAVKWDKFSKIQDALDVAINGYDKAAFGFRTAKHYDPAHPKAIAKIKSLTRGSKNGSLLVARYLITMKDAEQAERGVGVTHSPKLQDPTTLTFQKIIQISGITQKQIAELGYNADSDDPAAKLVGFANAGVVSVKDLQAMQGRLVNSSRRVLKTTAIQYQAKKDLNQKTMGLLARIQDEAAADAADVYYRELGHGPDPNDVTLAKQQAFGKVGEVISGYKKQADPDSPGQFILTPFGANLDASKATFDAKGVDGIEFLRQRKRVLDEISNTNSVPDPGELNWESVKWKNKYVRGNAERVQKALEAHEAGRMDEYNRLTAELAGLDVGTMLRPHWTKRRALSYPRPSLAELKSMGKAADRIVLSKRLDDIDKRIDRNLASQVTILKDRARSAPSLFNAVNRMIYAAIIDKLPENWETELRDGNFEPRFVVYEKRHEIEELLQSWGLDVTEDFRPEFEHALALPVDSDVLGDMKTDMEKYSFKELLEGPAEAEGYSFYKASRDLSRWWTKRRDLTEQMRDDFTELFGRLTPGEEYDLMSGVGVGLDSWKFPLDPASFFRLRGRLDISGIDRFRIKVDDDGSYKIQASFGGKVKFTGDLELLPVVSELGDAAGEFFEKSQVAYARVGARITASGAREVTNGIELQFAADDAGRQNAAKLLTALIEGTRPAASVLEPATNIAKVRRRKNDVQGKAALMGMFGAGTPAVAGDGNPNGTRTAARNIVDAGIELQAGYERTGGWSKETAENSQMYDVSYTREVKHRFFGYREFYYAVPTIFSAINWGVMTGSGAQRELDERVQNNDGNGRYNPGDIHAGYGDSSKDFAEKSFWTSVDKKSRSYKKVGEDSRTVLTSAKITSYLDGAKSKDKMAAVASVLPQSLRDILNDQDGSTEKQNLVDELTKVFKPLEDHDLKDTIFQVNYELHPEKLSIVQHLEETIFVLESKNLKHLAKSVRNEVAAILKDKENYTVPKITLLQKSTHETEKNRVNTLVVKAKLTTEVKSSRVLAEADLASL
ncbi:hypothetical protein [Yoonia sp. BS5-3]|uniref:Uncharacterized protein n=1 Tax=Yoonia phaeophyticola TaxID=3137369 RepID=A0ABZ3IDZ3_9RHOB